MVSMLSPSNSHHQYKPKTDVSHSILVPSGFSWTSLMAYSKAKLKSSCDKASPCFKPFWKGKLSEKCLHIQTLLYVSLKHLLMSLTHFMGTPNSIRILYNTSLLTESGFLEVCVEPMYCITVLQFFPPVSVECKKSDR
jgi:hypothetical protein